MRLRLNAIVSLRLINTFLFVWLMLRMPTFYEKIKQWTEYFLQKERPNFGTTSFSFSAVSNFRFFPLGSVRLEAIRMNEMLAKRSPFACQKKRKKAVINAEKGDDDGTFFFCAECFPEKGENKKFQYKNESEKILLINWPKKCHQQNNTTTKWENLDKTEDELVFMEFPEKQIEWQIERLKFRHLFLMLRPTDYADPKSGNEQNSATVLFFWYRFIHKLFFKWHFAIVGLRTIGKCGQMLQKFDMKHCEWRINFAKFEHFGQVEDIPSFGSGSPSEEKLRFFRLLLGNSNKNCRFTSNLDKFSSENWPCAPFNGAKFNKIVFIRYRNFRFKIDERKNALATLGKCAEKVETVILYPPENSNAAEMNLCVTTSHCFRNCTEFRETNCNLTLSSKNFGTFLDEFVQNLSERSIGLLLDLDGFEWEVLESIDESQKHCANWMKRVEELSLRIRLWKMEDSENWRRFYLRLLQLEECGGFERIFSKKIGNWNIQIIYRKKAMKRQPK
ncbi:hypothetical protein niasHS_011966 [Heterodera schachtii]|uniref:Uncharacterized protein n=2 Tax=Heterodera TaxID=34509 RepID=A0ABD2I5R4_HETSC